MSAPKLPEKIGFLVRRKFPLFDVLYKPIPLSDSAGWKERRQGLIIEANHYIEELRALDADVLSARYEEEKTKKAAEEQAAADKAESELFFNQPRANADFEFWSKAAYWTLDEAIALSLGKSPEIVKWENVQKHVQYVYDSKAGKIFMFSPFAKRYQQIRELALRAVKVQELYDPVLPALFLAWTKKNELDFPAALEEQLVARGIAHTDWRGAYEELAQKYAALKKSYQADLSQKETELAQALAKAREEVNARSEEAGSAEKPLHTRERESALKLIIGMALKGYCYDPSASRNAATQDIADDLAALGIGLDADTVRKWLKEGTELLPNSRFEKD